MVREPENLLKRQRKKFACLQDSGYTLNRGDDVGHVLPANVSQQRDFLSAIAGLNESQVLNIGSTTCNYSPCHFTDFPTLAISTTMLVGCLVGLIGFSCSFFPGENLSAFGT